MNFSVFNPDLRIEKDLLYVRSVLHQKALRTRMNAKACTPCSQKCAEEHSLSSGISFFVRISGFCTLQEKLRQFLPKLAGLCSDGRLILYGHGHFWSLGLDELNRPSSDEQYLISKDNEPGILIFTHMRSQIDSYTDSVRSHKREVQVNKGAFQTITKFSVTLRQYAVRPVGSFLYLPSEVCNYEPFASNESLKLTVYKKGDYTKIWNLRYKRRSRSANVTGFILCEWGKLVKQNNLEAGIECHFALKRKKNWVFELDFRTSERQGFDE